MKQTITIFVSGAKRLKEHRMRLKVLANDMNGEYRKRGLDVSINMYSYLNLGDDQKEYDDFIRHKSDIVFFLIEDTLGEKTRDEFLLASEAFRKAGAPKIYVFLKEFKEHTPEIEAIENLVNTNSSSYYIEYANLEDLESKVRNRLQKDVAERLDKLNVTPEKKLRKFKYWAIAATLACLSFVGYGVYSAVSRSDDVLLLFVGGGSAVNCLKENYEAIGDVYHLPNTISIGVPTSAAWSLVSAEILHHHALRGERVQTPFFPVCLSAKEATEADFLKMCDREQFVKKGSVLSAKIGEDRLMIYVKKSMDNPYVNGRDSIGVEDLSKLIWLALENDYYIFSTQEGSGTLLSYRAILAPYGIEITPAAMGSHLQWFSQQTPSSSIRRNEQPYILMGSEYYVSQEVYEEGDCRGLVVVDNNRQASKKTIFMYFAGYYHDEEGSTFWIPDEMVDFLLKLNPRYADVINGNLLPRRNEMVIVPLDDYLSKK